MKHNKISSMTSNFCLNEWVVLGFLMLARLFSMYAIPLNDSTEARYGEMAREMLLTGDWITLWHLPGVPFWGKPPFTIWLSALSMKWFGVSELAARLPSLILSILVLYLIFDLVKTYRGMFTAKVSLFVLASSFIFYLASGTVMMDPALMCAVTICHVSYWKASQTFNKLDGYVFFLGLAMGILSKGPIVLILVGGSVGLWVIWAKQWSVLWRALPWIRGSILMLVIALPWYCLAEHKTPGFLNYFIVGEHFSRFFQAGWQGDKYGFAHAQPLGAIWPYALAGTMPWSLLLFVKWLTTQPKFHFSPPLTSAEKSWIQYWLICFLFPLMFFTFARNLIYPYTLPVLPAFSICFAEMWARKNDHSMSLILIFSTLTGLFFVAASVLFFYYPERLAKSDNRMVKLWQRYADHSQNELAYWKHSLAFSSFFYSHGHVVRMIRIEDMCKLTHPKGPAYFVVNKNLVADLQQTLGVPVTQLGQVRTRDEIDVLVKAEQIPVTC